MKVIYVSVRNEMLRAISDSNRYGRKIEKFILTKMEERQLEDECEWFCNPGRHVPFIRSFYGVPVEVSDD